MEKVGKLVDVVIVEIRAHQASNDNLMDEYRRGLEESGVVRVGPLREAGHSLITGDSCITV